MFDLKHYSDRIAVVTNYGDSLTYGMLQKEADSFCERFVIPGLVFCLCRNQLGALVGYVGCMVNHIPIVLLDGEKPKDLYSELIRRYSPEYLWLPSERSASFPGDEIYCRFGYSLIRLTYESQGAEKELNPDLQLCLTTSGSTGSPKFVRLSLENLRSNALSIVQYLNISDQDRAITTLPMYYSFGVSVINSHLITGATILLTDGSIVQREFWNFMKLEKATSISGVPYTYEMLKRLRFFRMELPDLKVMIQAGGKLSPDLVKEYAAFAESKGKQFVVMYGQTEASPRMSYLPPEKACDKPDSIGIPIPGGHFKIQDQDGHEVCGTDVDGELIYSGENVCLGYAENRDDLALGNLNHGELHTGDIAHRDEDGYYYITGRLKRFVKVFGNRVNLDSMEQLLKNIVSDCAVVGVDDRITCFITDSGLEHKIFSYLAENTGIHYKAFEVRTVDSIPKNDRGKIAYQELQDLVII